MLSDISISFTIFLMCDTLNTTSKNSFCCLKVNTSIKRNRYP